MAVEIIYTSVERGLRTGSHGFCTVAASKPMPNGLVERLEALSAYRHLYPPHDPRAKLNPVAYSHLVIENASVAYHVLSSVRDTGLDYSGRGNKLAHHVALLPGELPPAGPALLLSQPGFMQSEFDGEPRALPPKIVPAAGDIPLSVCTAWRQLTGDPGWAGVLAESAGRMDNADAYIVFGPGMQMLPLVREALSLMSPRERWRVTFSTYVTRLPPGLQCRWRCVAQGTPEAAAARQVPGSLVIDLTQPLGSPPESRLVDAARTGRMAASRPHWAETEPADDALPLDGPPASEPSRSSAAAPQSAAPGPPPPRPQPPALPASSTSSADDAPVSWRVARATVAGCLLVALLGLLGWQWRDAMHQRERAELGNVMAETDELIKAISALASEVDRASRAVDHLTSEAKHVRQRLPGDPADLHQRMEQDMRQWRDQLDISIARAEQQLKQVLTHIDQQQLARASTMAKQLHAAVEDLQRDLGEIDIRGQKHASLLSDIQAVASFPEKTALIEARSLVRVGLDEVDDIRARLERQTSSVDHFGVRYAGLRDLVEVKRQLRGANRSLRETRRGLSELADQLTILDGQIGHFQQVGGTVAPQRALDQFRVAIDNRRQSVAGLQQEVSGVENRIRLAERRTDTGTADSHNYLPTRDSHIVVFSDYPPPISPGSGEIDRAWRQPIQLASIQGAEPHDIEIKLLGGAADYAVVRGQEGTVQSHAGEAAGPRPRSQVVWTVQMAGHQLAILTLVDDRFLFQWAEGAGELPISADRLRHCVLVVRAGQKREAIALAAAARGERVRFALRDVHQVTVSVSRVSDEQLTLKLILPQDAKAAKYSRNDTEAQFQLAEFPQIVCAVRISGEVQTSERESELRLTSEVRVDHQGQSFKPIEFLTQQIRQLQDEQDDLEETLQATENPRKRQALQREIDRRRQAATQLKAQRRKLDEFFNNFAVDIQIIRVWPAENVSVTAYRS